MIDFHCHLDLYPDALALLPQVSARNVFTLVVTTSPRAFLATSRVFAGHPRIHVGLGLHPEVAVAKAGEIEQLVALVSRATIVGEIGLDGSPRFRATLPTQRRVFSFVVAECEAQGGRVMSIHSRGAESEVLDVLERHPRAGVAVLHWFSGTQRELQRAIELGAWFSVGPAMLRGLKGRELAARMLSGRVLPETDGPFAQEAGRPLMPWEAWSVCPTLAAGWGRTADEVQQEMLSNLRSLLPSVPLA